ncbi:MAG TPA: serine hydrolase domain-containing protein [Gammaproteobacteria bacterium]
MNTLTRMRAALLFGSAALLVLIGPALAAQEITNSAATDAYLDRAVAETKIPGLVALVVDENRVIYSHTAGLSNVAAGTPMSLDTIFNIASMTKPVAVAGIMLLVEEGKLSLDDPISKYVPEFATKPVMIDFNAEAGTYATRPAASEATIRQLLSHSSGLSYPFSSAKVARLSGTPGFDASTLPLLTDPGTEWRYAGGIAVVGGVLERIEDQTLDVFLEERLLGPLGMTDTAYAVPNAKRERVVTVHRMTDNGLVEAPVPAEVRSAVSGDGGLYSTAPDYAKFIQLVLNHGRAPGGMRLLAPESLAEMSRNQLVNIRVELQDEPLPLLARAFPLGAGRDGFGLGFQITGAHADDDERAPGSLSWAGIFNTQFWIDPENGIGGVLLMQYLPFYDEEAIATLVGFEALVYEGLAAR